MGLAARTSLIASVLLSAVVAVGHTAPASAATPAIVPVVPARVLETRVGVGNVTVDGGFEGVGVVPAGGLVELVVAGRGGVASDAVAVMLNVTATGALSAGFLTVFPCGAERPLASSVNYSAGQTVPKAVLAKVGVGGKVCIWSKSATDVVADVTAFVPAGTDGGGGGGDGTGGGGTGGGGTGGGGGGTVPGGVGTLPRVGSDDQRLVVGPDGSFHLMFTEEYGGASLVYGRCSADCERDASWQFREIARNDAFGGIWLSVGGLGVDSTGRVHAIVGGWTPSGNPGPDGQYYVTCAAACNTSGTWTTVDFTDPLVNTYANGDRNLLTVTPDDRVAFLTDQGNYMECAGNCTSPANWSTPTSVIEPLDGGNDGDVVTGLRSDAHGRLHVLYDVGNTVEGDTVYAYARCTANCSTPSNWVAASVAGQVGGTVTQGAPNAHQVGFDVTDSGDLFISFNQGNLASIPDEPYNGLLVVTTCEYADCLDAATWDFFAFADPALDDATPNGDWTSLATYGDSVALTAVSGMHVLSYRCDAGCTDPDAWTVADVDRSQAINASVPASPTCDPAWYWPKYTETALGELGMVAVHRGQPLCGTPPHASYGGSIGRVVTDF